MNKKKLKSVWQAIQDKEKCKACPLCEMQPLIMKAGGSVKGMVITEGPNKKEKDENIASFGNHPTYTFLYTLFSGKAKFLRRNANVYWTHVRKCFLRNGRNKSNREKKALSLCRSLYLKEEIQALKPKFIVAVGGEALKFFLKYDQRLSKKIEDVVFVKKGIFKNVRIENLCFRLIVLPHPSGLNRIWVDLRPTDYEVLHEIKKDLSNILSR